MKLLHLMPTLCLVAPQFSCVSLGVLLGQCKTDPDPLDAVLRIWKAQDSSIVTIYCKLRMYRHAGYPASTMTRKRFLQEIATLKAENFSQFLDSFHGQVPPPEHPRREYWGDDVEIFQQGVKVRNNVANSHDKSPENFTYLFNGKEEIHFNPLNHQATLIPGRSGVLILGIRDLRYFPEFYAMENERRNWVVEDRSDGKIRLCRSDSSIEADEQSGRIYHILFNDAHGTPIQEIFEFGYMEYPGNIDFPTFSINASYRDGKIAVVSFYRVEECVFNEDLPESIFSIGAPKGAMIVDLRKDAKKPRQVFAPDSVTDVVEFADSIRSDEEMRPPIRSRSFLLTIAGVSVGLVFLLIGIKLWGRRAKVPHNPMQ